MVVQRLCTIALHRCTGHQEGVVQRCNTPIGVVLALPRDPPGKDLDNPSISVETETDLAVQVVAKRRGTQSAPATLQTSRGRTSGGYPDAVLQTTRRGRRRRSTRPSLLLRQSEHLRIHRGSIWPSSRRQVPPTSPGRRFGLSAGEASALRCRAIQSRQRARPRPTQARCESSSK